MDRLNYFLPYESKTEYHEDNLTRAFLLVLKYSPNAMLHFFDYMITELRERCVKEDVAIKIENLNDLNFRDIDISTQVRNLRDISKGYLISVLITDMKLDRNITIEPTNRNAIYDGLITINNDITLFIENKPSANNVWDGQLNPALKDLGEIKDVTQLIPVPAILTWSKIIRNFNRLYSANILSYQETILFRDFFDYVDNYFPLLNPFDNFSLCKCNHELLIRRTKNILESIVSEEYAVQYMSNYEYYYIETKLPEVSQATLKIRHKNEPPNDWYLDIIYYFGETMPQARKFYGSANFSALEELEEMNWSIECNLNLSYVSRKLMWMSSQNNDKYFEYWTGLGMNNICQLEKQKMLELLIELDKKGIIIFDEEKKNEFQVNFTDTDRHTVNINPAFAISFAISSTDAVEKDMKGALTAYIKDKMIEGLSIIDKNCLFLK